MFGDALDSRSGSELSPLAFRTPLSDSTDKFSELAEESLTVPWQLQSTLAAKRQVNLAA